MGTWGPGNFENDGASDYRDSITQQLVQTIETCFRSRGGSDLDEGGETTLVPSIAMLSVLCEHCSAVPPKAELVQGWRERYLAIYDSQIDKLGAFPAYKVNRRQTIEATFNKLEAQSRAFWKS